MLLLWYSHAWTIATHYLLTSHHSILIPKLQHVENLAARLALDDSHSPVQQIFVQLYWRPIHSRIKFKMSFKLVNENQSVNLKSILTPYAPVAPHLLRSTDKCHEQAHHMENMVLLPAHLWFGTPYHSTFDSLHLLHHLILLQGPGQRNCTCLNSAIFVHVLFIYLWTEVLCSIFV